MSGSGAEETGGRTLPEPAEPTFAPGLLVASRYRILRFLGQGAVGEVYGAEDLDLKSHVALKLLRPGVAGDLHSIARFKREILLARRVSHPNICRIFDFGVHHLPAAGGAPGEDRSLPFLTMEWLEGETLARRIHEGGALDDGEVVRLATQLCQALDAAHAADVVHRDLKSANILLVGERAVVTDFGLARSERSSSDGLRLTEHGGLVGTPAYMSPEQVAGRPATPASDIFSLGVVLYEAMTGALPYQAATPIEMAVKRLHEGAVPIETYRKEIPARFRDVVMRCLERDPEQRFASAGAVARALDPPTHRVELGTPHDDARSRAPRRRGGALVLGLLAIALVAAGLWAVAKQRSTSSPATASSTTRHEASPSTVKARASLAVLGFGNSLGRPEAQWIAAALTEMLTTELAAGERLRIVPGESVARAKIDLGLVPAQALSRETLARLREMLDAEFVVLGSYVALEAGSQGAGAASLRLDFRLQSTRDAGTRSFSIEGAESTIFDLTRQAGERLRADLGVGTTTAPRAGALEATLSRSPEAVRLYAEGLERGRGFEPAAARDLFRRAIESDPSFAQAHAALASTLAELGYEKEAIGEAARAFELATDLPRADVLTIEGLYRRLGREWEKATEIARTLRRFYPDDLEHGLRLATVEIEAGDARAAEATVAELRALPAPAGDDPRLDLVEARASELLSDFRRQQTAAERAASKAERSGARSILAHARFEEGSALRKLGDPDAAVLAFESSRALSRALGNRGEAALATQALANLERSRGELDRAERLFEEARAAWSALGNRFREARLELSIGRLASERGNIVAASEHYERARTVLSELGDRRGAAAASANLGTMYYLEWRLAEAEQEHQLALAEFRGLGDRAAELVALANLAQIARERGNFTRSTALWNEALAIARETGGRSGEASALLGRGENAEIVGDETAARRDLEAAATLFRTLDERPRLDAVELALARLDRGQGRYREAAEALSRIAREAGERGDSDLRLEAELEEARALAGMEAKRSEAWRLSETASKLAIASPSPFLRHLGRLVAAEADLARGQYDRAAQTLAPAKEAAVSSGHRLAELEARLAIVAVGTARAAEGRGGPVGDGVELERLISEAQTMGYGRLVRQAEALQKGAPLSAKAR